MTHQVIPKVIPSAYTKKNEGNIAFRFKLPDKDLALRSVRFVNDVPELTFVASRKVPTIQEADVATAFRLVYEEERPEFFYRDFPPGHPLRGRWFKQYSPAWLRWTGVGRLLADVDWNMKCLHAGTRSNEEKTKFWSWASESQLTGLTNYEDFPNESVWIRSVVMSCESAKLLKNENELMFPEEPKMMITDGGSKLYTKYISEILPSIAYYDEPKFLKMQELIKLILAVEWLHKEKGVCADFEWMMSHTSKPSHRNSTQPNNKHKLQKPTNDMIPQPSECKQPTTNATVATWEAGKNKTIVSRSGIKRHYGYIDYPFQEVHLYEEDGTPCLVKKSLKCKIQGITPVGKMTYFQCIPISDRNEDPEEIKQLRKTALKSLPEKEYEKISHQLPLAVKTTECGNNENGATMEISKSLFPMVIPTVKDIHVVTATVDDYDLLYAGMDPNMPIVGAGGFMVIPSVQSWSELVTELSEVQPGVFKLPHHPMVNSMACGGVCTQHIPVTEKSLPARTVNKPRQRSGVYSSCGNSVTIQATNTKMQGTIQLVSKSSNEFERISAFVRERWISSKGRSPPLICEIFIINNPVLLKRWERLKFELGQKSLNESEIFFHGTTLACDIASSKCLCCNPECAICSISHNGMKLERIGLNNSENPRFGKGLYFALHSSKSDDYSNAPRNKSHYKAILMCDILLGKCQKIYENGNDRNEDHGDYDSILGELGSKTSLPELLVRNPAAVLPRCIIIYQNIGGNSSGPAKY